MYQEKNLTTINKKSFFDKIISFFKNFFTNSKEKNENESIIDIKRDFSKVDFLDTIKIRDEDPKLLDVQNKLENNKIYLSDLSDEQVTEINALYERQINKLNDTVKRKVSELRMLKNKINSKP